MEKKNIYQNFFEEISLFLSPLGIFFGKNPLHGINYIYQHYQSENVSNIKENDETEKIIPFIINLINAFEQFKELIQDKQEFDPQTIISLYPSVKSIFQEIENLKSFDLGELESIGGKIVQFLFSEYLNEKDDVRKYLNFLGLIESNQIGFPLLNFRNLEDLFTNPIQHLSSFYNWKKNNFNAQNLLINSNELFQNFGLKSYILPQTRRIIEEEVKSLDSEIINNTELRFPILQAQKASSDFFEFGLSLMGDYNPTLNNTFLAIFPYGNLQQSSDFNLKNGKILKLETSLNLEEPVNLIFNSENQIYIDSQKDNDLRFKIYVDNSGTENDTKNYQFSGGTIGINSISYGLEFISNKNEKDVNFFLSLDQVNFLLSQDEGDELIKKLYKGDQNKNAFSLLIKYSLINGITVDGITGFQWRLPFHKKNKFISFKELWIQINPTNLGLEFFFRISFTAKLGAVNFGVSELGIFSNLILSNKDIVQNNLGFANLDFGFSPPIGVSISLDPKSPIKGAGYLENDKENNRYVGALQLNLKAIELSATAIITTKLPNNKKGFSLLISISAIFRKGIPLPFGFELKGVGGLITLNRTMDVEAIRQRLITGAINSIMFPVDVVENIDKVVGDLEAVFPIKKGHTVIAPFMKVIWGSGKEIELDVGLFVEFPFKGRIVLLGSLGIYMPEKPKIIRDKLGNPKVDEDGNNKMSEPKIEIHVEILGDFNFGEGYVRLEGILRDSHLMGAPLTGGFVFVLAGGNSPQFLFSVGGYHPRYDKPPKYPEVPRVSAVISKGDDISISCAFYTAITSNSFQIGVRADLLVKAADFKVTGYFSFDALLQFDPFLFEVAIGMGVSVFAKGKELAGVELYFMLAGPKPWRVVGFARIKIAFIKLKVKFDKTWGGKLEKAKPSYIEPSVIVDALVTQFKSQSNWTARLPENYQGAEEFRKLEAEALVVLHPKGTLEVRQMVVPLQFQIEKWGGSDLKQAQSFDIIGLQFGQYTTKKDGTSEMVFQKIDISQQLGTKEHFATSQFENIAEEERLSKPDFTLLKAGYLFQTLTSYHFSPRKNATNQSTEVYSTGSEYEEIIIDKNLVSHKNEPQATSRRSSRRRENPIAKFGRRKSARRQRFLTQTDFAFGQTETLGVYKETTYCIVDRSSLKSLDLVFSSEYEARAYIKKEYKEEQEKWQIMTTEACQIQKDAATIFA